MTDMFEHRKVAWDAGVLVDPSLEVHHPNHNRSDNRPENLDALDGSAHALMHAEEDGFVL